MHIVHSAGNMGLFKQTEECTFPSDGVIVVVAPVAVACCSSSSFRRLE